MKVIPGMKDTISEALEMNTLTAIEGAREVEIIQSERSTVEFTEVKDNLRQLINKSTPAFNSLVALALASESPKAFEQLSNMMRVIVEANRELADTHVKQVNVTGEKAPTTINNNLNISTTELLKMIKDSKNE